MVSEVGLRPNTQLHEAGKNEVAIEAIDKFHDFIPIRNTCINEYVTLEGFQDFQAR